MNARIAAILKDRISQFTYVDRIAGMVRTAQIERSGQVVKLPVAIDVDAALACYDSTLRDMVPDEAYACMVYFEDRGFQRITSRTRGTSFRSSIRLVCWINTAKFSSDPMAGERIMQQFLAEVHQPGPVNTDTLVGLRTTAETSPERGGGLFAAYTYPESSRQYLLWPFDAFAIDIAAEYRLRPGCEEEPVPGDDTCWTPPTTKRRRNPSEFTCEELQDPETGLTAEQLGPECLDCDGGGECPATTVNGVTSDTPTITVLQGGVEVGTLNPATGVHTVPECPVPPVPECDDLVDAVVVEGAGLDNVNGLYRRDDSAPVPDDNPNIITRRYTLTGPPQRVIFGIEINPGEIFWTIWCVPDEQTIYDSNPSENPWGTEWVDASDNPPPPTVRQATIADLCPCATPEPCPLSITVNDEAFDTVADQCATPSFNVPVVNEDDEAVGGKVGPNWVVPTAKSLCALVTEGTAEDVATCVTSSGKRPGVLAELIPTVAEPDTIAQVFDVMTAGQQALLDVTVQLQDSAGNNLGAADVYPATTSTTKTAPDGSVQRRDSAGNAIGSPIAVRSNQTGLDVTCPDGAVSLNSTPVGNVKSNGALNIPVTLAGAPAAGSWTGSAYNVTHPARVIRQYTSSDAWTKPAGLREVFVLVAGAGGGGGGAGRRPGVITGASGGGGGAVRWLRMDASELGPTETITIGAGGAGGAGGTIIQGSDGGAGGSSSFGSFITAAGGSGGNTSQSSGSIAGGAGGTTSDIRFFLPGAAGGNAQVNQNGYAGGNGWAQLTSGAGGGGGGASTNTPLSWAGGAGGGVFAWDGSAWSLIAGPTGPPANTGAGGNGVDDQCLNILQSFIDVPTIGLGTGGAGGAGSSGTGSATGNRGGNGGRAAGGGGGGSVQGGTGGNGGNGGGGFCIIVEIY